MKNRYEKPNYTQIPNAFLDEVLPEISTASELKVTLAIMRKTFGWHKDEDKLSLSQLTDLTGLTRRSVAEGVSLAMKRGYVGRRKEGQSYIYGLRIRYEDSSYEPSSSEDSSLLTSEGIIPTKESIKEKGTSSSKDVDGSPSPGTFVGYLREELDGSDVPLLRNREDRYAGEFNRVMKKGMQADVLYKACDRIVERWKGDEHRKLTVEQAIEDVVNGKPPAHTQKNGSGTPPEAIEYVFANARGDYFANNESRVRRAMELHDFTGYESPSYPTQKMLGGTDQEIWQAMDGLTSLLRQWRRRDNNGS